MENLPFAIVRAFGDEPYRLQVRIGGEDIKVYSPSGDASIPYPSAFVYEFEDELFADLTTAYRRGDSTLLSVLWRKARLIADH